MPIKNRDGTLYRLKGPNPLMKTQEVWGSSRITLHNFPDHQPISQEPNLVPTIEPPPPEPKTEPPPTETPKSTNIIKVHCLHGFVTTHLDPLQNTEHQTTLYGNKFEFEAILLDKSDLTLLLWTRVKTIHPGSILFPMTGHARWWRVKVTEPQTIGFRLVCEPSSEQPSFSASQGPD